MLILIAHVFGMDVAILDTPYGGKRELMAIMAGAAGLSLILPGPVMRRFHMSVQ
jgi:hypothetical protein